MERKTIEIDLYEVRTMAQRSLDYLVSTREVVCLGKNEKYYQHYKDLHNLTQSAKNIGLPVFTIMADNNLSRADRLSFVANNRYFTPLHLTDEMKSCINFDKFLNDWYRYEVLGQKEGVINKHDFSLIKPIYNN